LRIKIHAGRFVLNTNAKHAEQVRSVPAHGTLFHASIYIL